MMLNEENNSRQQCPYIAAVEKRSKAGGSAEKDVQETKREKLHVGSRGGEGSKEVQYVEEEVPLHRIQLADKLAENGEFLGFREAALCRARNTEGLKIFERDQRIDKSSQKVEEQACCMLSAEWRPLLGQTEVRRGFETPCKKAKAEIVLWNMEVYGLSMTCICQFQRC